MRVSRSSLGALVVAGAVLALPAAAGAQVPGAQTPGAQTPGAPIPLIAPPNAAVPLPPVTSAIAGTPLPPPAAGWSGAPTAEAGRAAASPLPPDFWHGTSRALAKTLLARLATTTSPAVQDLERRLLLSPGAAPAPAPGEGAAEGSSPDLAELRAAALIGLGELDAARTVIAALPEAPRAAALPLVVAADAIAGDTDHACAEVERAIHRDQGVFWQRALIACQVLQDKSAEASLGLQVLEEQKVARDDALAIAVEALAGQPAPALLSRIENADPLVVRALVAAHRRFAPGLVAGMRPELALTLALDTEAPPDMRLAAGERAALCGALPAAGLAALYRDFGADRGFAADSEPHDVPGKPTRAAEIARARRFAGIAAAAGTADRLAAIVAFADTFPARERGGFMLAARLVAPALRGIAPDPGLAVSADTVARLEIAAGDDEDARKWAALAPPAARSRLRQVLALADRSDEGARRVSAGEPLLVATLGQALGGRLSPESLTAMPAAAWTRPGPPAPPPAAWLDLADAASGHRVGETVLAAALVVAPQGVLTDDPVALGAAVASLRRVGLAGAARRLAVEALVAR